MQDLAVGAVSLIVLAAVVGAVPFVLWNIAGWPLPHGPVTLDALRRAIDSPIPDSFWPKALAGVGWIVWGWLAGGAVAEAVSTLRVSRDHRRLSASARRHPAARLVVRVAVAAAILWTLAGHSGSAQALSAGRGPEMHTEQVVVPSTAARYAAPFGFTMAGACATLAIERLRQSRQRRTKIGGAIRMDPARAEESGRENGAAPARVVDLPGRENGAAPALVTHLRSRTGTDDSIEPDIVVRVLGPVDIVGAPRPFTRSRSFDLVVYLAMHPHGVDRDAWSEAMWPDRLVPRPTVDSTVSVARTTLGLDRNGDRHLPTGRGRLRLGPNVVSDWDVFCALVECDGTFLPAHRVPGSALRGAPAGASGGAESVAEALALVRGRLFAGLHNADWTVFEGIAAAMESRIVDVATGAGEVWIASGEPDRAAWAARQGLAVNPYDERLYRILMKSADARGSRAGVVSAMDELRVLLDDDEDLHGTIHPETEELYRHLTGASAGIGLPPVKRRLAIL